MTGRTPGLKQQSPQHMHIVYSAYSGLNWQYVVGLSIFMLYYDWYICTDCANVLKTLLHLQIALSAKQFLL